MRKSILNACCIVWALFIYSPSDATTIVDTGDGPIGTNGSEIGLDPGQFLAAEFNTTNDFIVTSVEGWISLDSPSPGEFSATAAIYSDGGEVPGTELFVEAFTIPIIGNGWYGPTELSWYLPAGYYWVSFEVREGQTYTESMSGLNEIPSPLLNEAVYTSSSGGWFEYDNLNTSVKITASPVPIPSAAWLFGSGLIGLARGKA